MERPASRLREYWLWGVVLVGTVVALLLPGLRLVSETAALSREKVRRQFALDSAAAAEMENYSDFLNRSAYVNGAFSQRVFHEGFHKTCIEMKNGPGGDCGAGGDRLETILYRNGVFPRTRGHDLDRPLDDVPVWDIAFGGNGSRKNRDPSSIGGVLELLTMQNALDYWLSWDNAQDVYKLYVQIYQLLGSVEAAQWSVFKRLTRSHNFFRKSYWLNAGEAVPADSGSVKSFDARPFRPQPYCIPRLMIYGNKPTGNAFQPYQIWAPQKPITMPETIPGCRPGPGLFQVMVVPDADLEGIQTAHRIVQGWRTPENSFGVDLDREFACQDPPSPVPCVRAAAAIVGGRLWPNPTPKFQVAIRP